MGCDIHPFMEVKFKEDGEWIYAGSLEGDRNYSLFGKLSGVRGEGTETQFFASDCEFPGDASEELAEEWASWSSDGHSMTIIDFDGLKRFCKKYHNNPTEKWSDQDEDEWPGWTEDKFNHWKGDAYVNNWFKVAEKLVEGGVKDVRVVLWYDN